MDSFVDFVKVNFTSLVAIILGVSLMSLLHFYNGFPLLMTDSIGYLMRAFNLSETSHWSNSYTAFVSIIIHTFHSVHWVAIFQNLVMALVLYIFCKTYAKNIKHYTFLAILSALMFTTLPWICTMVMSDVFTPITLMALILILDGQLKGKAQYVFLSLILFIGISAHQSHLLIVPVFSMSLLFIKYISSHNVKLPTILKSMAIVFVLMLASNIFEKNIFNQKVSTKAQAANVSNPDVSSGYYFVAVRIAESGELKYILDRFCDGNRDNYVCNGSNVYNASRVKSGSAGLRRNPNNTKYIDYSLDNKELVFFALTKPRFYMGIARLVVKKGSVALKNTKLRTYKRPNGLPMKRLKSILDKINKTDNLTFVKSKQAKNVISKLIMAEYDKIHKFWWFVLCPITLLFVAYLYLKKESEFSIKHKRVFLFLILGHVINTLICTTFSNYANVRYSNRTFWLLNLVLILIFIQVIQFFVNRKRKLNA